MLFGTKDGEALMNLFDKTVTELHDMLMNRQCSAKELLEDVFQRAESVQNKLNCYITFNENSFQEAETADKMLASGEGVTMLTGIPIAVKDNISTKGLRTTCASRMLESYIPPYDATVIERLKAAGAVITGKTNMDEFAMGSASDTGIFGRVGNPIKEGLSAGGSSGGSAAAVASGAAVIALGSDTGGSVRQPASLCGIVGFCPSYGAVSRYGLIAFASSLDRIGSFGKNVMDTYLLHNIINGYDSKDVTTFRKNFSFEFNNTLNGTRIGIPNEISDSCMSEDVEGSIRNALHIMEKRGANLVTVSLPSIKEAVKAYYIISSAEASSNLARYDGVRYGHRSADASDISYLYRKSRTEGFGSEVKRRIMLGTFALSEGYSDAYYKRAAALRNRLCQEYDDAFKQCDIITSPVYPRTSISFDEPKQLTSVYSADIFTVPSSLAGLPAISVPCGRSREGLPVGLQLIGRKYDDKSVFNTAYGFELGGGAYGQY